jgi:hypothetical protein
MASWSAHAWEGVSVAASVAEIYQTNRSTAFWGWCCHQWLKKSWIPRHNTRWPHDRHMHEIVAYVWRRLWLRFIKQIGQQLFEGDGVIIGWIKVNKSWTRRHNTRWPHDQVLVANNSKRKLEKASSIPISWYYVRGIQMKIKKRKKRKRKKERS